MAAAERDLTGSLDGIPAWIVTDGKAGDEEQCLAVAAASGLAAEIRRVAPRAPWCWAMPWGPVDPRERPGLEGGPLRGPLPGLAIGSGRRAVASLRALRRVSGGRVFTAFLKDPRVAPGTFDFVWAPSHDRVRGRNVLLTPTSPHRISVAALAQARSHPDPRLAAVRRPRVAVLVGGQARAVPFDDSAARALLGGLRLLAKSGAGLAITSSRRTPDGLRRDLAALARENGGFFFDGSGPNPYLSILAEADAIVVTADSINMLSEAVATGRPVHAFVPGPLPRRHRAFLEGLVQAGAVRPFAGRLETFTYPPLDATPVIAAALAAAYADWKDGRASARSAAERGS